MYTIHCIVYTLWHTGSSIKDVRKEGERGQGKRDTCGHRGEGGQARVDVHKKILKKVSKKT